VACNTSTYCMVGYSEKLIRKFINFSLLAFHSSTPFLSGSKLLAEFTVLFTIVLPASVYLTPTLLAWNWLLPTIQCISLQFRMDWQVAKPLFCPAASENETEYENSKFEVKMKQNMKTLNFEAD